MDINIISGKLTDINTENEDFLKYSCFVIQEIMYNFSIAKDILPENLTFDIVAGNFNFLTIILDYAKELVPHILNLE